MLLHLQLEERGMEEDGKIKFVRLSFLFWPKSIKFQIGIVFYIPAKFDVLLPCQNL